MLNLTRKVGQSIMVGDEVCITVIEMHGGWVRLSFNAPEEIQIHRSEVYERLRGQTLFSDEP